MRVLLVTRPGTGGVGRHVLDLVRGLRDRHELRILASPLEDPLFIERLQALGAPVVPFPLKRAPALFADRRAVRKLRKEIERFAPEVVHAHAFKAGAVARRAEAGVPVVYSPHGFYHLYPTAPRMARRAALAVERKLAIRTDVLALSAEWERDTAERDNIAAADFVVVVPNGVSPPRPLPEERRRELRMEVGALLDNVLVVMAGRLAPPKAPEDFVRAAAAAGSGFRFVLVGDGPELKICRQLGGRTGNLRLLGYRSDLDDILLAADIHVLATRYEAAPYVLLQAMAAGKPCIATDLPATREILGDAGVLVRPGPVPLAEAIREIAQDRERRADLSRRARARVETHYSMERMFAATEQAWDSAR